MPTPGVINKIIRYCETDDHGQCTIASVPWGEYKIFAGKDAEGYPDFPSPFYGLNACPIVKLQPASATASVAIHLPPKAGAIEPIAAIDAKTGEVLRSAAITLRRVIDPADYVQTSTTSYPVMVPSNADVSVEVTAPGYESWPSEDRQKEGQIRLRPEQAVELDVMLAREGSDARSLGTFRPGVLAWRNSTATPPPTPGSKILSSATESFSVTAPDVSVPLLDLAKRYHVPIGFAALPRGPGGIRSENLRIDAKAGTVRDLLNAIVQADPAYTWQEAELGVIDVFPKAHIDSLLDVVVRKYSPTNVHRTEAINDLLETPEVQRWMQQNGVTRREQVNTTSQSSPGEIIYRITMREGSSVRSILNCILSLSGGRYWMYYQWGDHNQYFALAMSE